MTKQIVVSAAQFFEQINTYLDESDRINIQEAFALARREHGDQRRKSGELFFTHPLTVAYYLSEYKLDAPALTAALLHDVAEDTRVTIDQIGLQFGTDVANVVDGVTKLKDVSDGVAALGRHLTKEELQDATLQKLFTAMTRDVRTVIIKLFDRLHNMRTLGAMPPHKQQKIANETLSVYSPLANRLGMWVVMNELESLAFEIINPHTFKLINQQLGKNRTKNMLRFKQIRQQICQRFAQKELPVKDVIFARENVHTIYQGLKNEGAPLTNVDKTLRMVVLLPDWPSCYLALAHVHDMWTPVPDTFRDYIAIPRDNLYQALHTTIVFSDGQSVRIRFRTPEMEELSQIGVLAQWQYAETDVWSSRMEQRLASFFNHITENINVEPQDPSAGVKGVVEDLFRRQINVYTPNGDVIQMASGATPLDFAYAIHTAIGNQCEAAYVNESLHPLNQPLKDGDQVRIVKRLRARPRRDWLDEDLGYVATQYARSHIARWFRRLSPADAEVQGRMLLRRELEMLGLLHLSHETVATLLNYESVQALYHDVGRAELLPALFATRVLEDDWQDEPSRSLDNVVRNTNGEEFVVTHANGRNLRLCDHCQPRPPEKIVGYLRKNEAVTIHRINCHYVNPQRIQGNLLKLGWGEAARKARLVTLHVGVFDRPGLLLDIGRLLNNESINIHYVQTPKGAEQGKTFIVLTLEITEPRQLVRILHRIQALDNVKNVRYVRDDTLVKNDLLPPSLYRPE